MFLVWKRLCALWTAEIKVTFKQWMFKVLNAGIGLYSCLYIMQYVVWTAQGHSNTFLITTRSWWKYFFLTLCNHFNVLSLHKTVFITCFCCRIKKSFFVKQLGRYLRGQQSCFCWNRFSPGWVGLNILTLASLIWIGLFMFSPQQRESYKRSLFVRIACVSYQGSQAQAYFQTAHKDPVWPTKNPDPTAPPTCTNLSACISLVLKT